MHYCGHMLAILSYVICEDKYMQKHTAVRTHLRIYGRSTWPNWA